MDLKFIYCRGGDKQAPLIAKKAGMLYGVRYDYTAYDDVYMLDAGLDPSWTTYKRKVAKLKPQFALVPDFEIYRDATQMALYIQDLRELGVPLIGVTPKFEGALAQIQIADDIIICESIPTTYSGYLIKDYELRPCKYHLLGGDIRVHLQEIRRIRTHGGEVVSIDANKLAMKAAHGQIWNGKKWESVQSTTYSNAITSAQNIMQSLKKEYNFMTQSPKDKEQWVRYDSESLIEWGNRLSANGLLDSPDVRWEYQKQTLALPAKAIKWVISKFSQT